VSSKDSNRANTAVKAARRGHEAVAERLLAWDDVDLNSRDKKGEMVLSFKLATE